MSNAKYAIPTPPAPTQFQLQSPRGARLTTRVWPSHNKPTAILVLVHGSGWHSGYFDEFASYLSSQAGIFCASYDQVCHGYSEPEPRAPNGFLHVNTFDDLVEDVFAATVWAKQEAGYSNLPVFLYGESFGGVQVLEAAFQAKFFGVALAGVICSSAVLEIDASMKPPELVVSICSWLAPYYPRMKLPSSPHMAKSFDDAFGDKKWAQIARSDPRVTPAPAWTLGGSVACLTAGSSIRGRASSFPVPLLAIHALGDCKASFRAVEEFVDRVPTAEGFWIEDSSGHQMLQDRPESTRKVMVKVADWILQHLP